MTNVVFSSSGITSWGDTWEWTFDGGVELKATDGHTLLVTDLNTQIPDYNFEDDLYDRSFLMSQAQDAEWSQICWNCYLLESMIYSMAWESFRSCVDPIVQEFMAKKPEATWVQDNEFSDMLTACLNAIRKQQGWSSEELEWLFDCNGSISAAVDEWLTDFLERQGLQVTYYSSPSRETLEQKFSRNTFFKSIDKYDLKSYNITIEKESRGKFGLQS